MTESHQRWMQLLLTTEKLGYQKPIQLLRHIRHHLGNDSASADTTIFRELFLQQLPHQVRMILSVSSSNSFEALAEKADKIMEVGIPGIAAVHRDHAVAADTPSLDDHLECIVESNANLVRQVNKLTTQLAGFRLQAPRSLPEPPFNGRNHRVPPSPPRSSSICRYHARYGACTRQCHPPCNFAENYQTFTEDGQC